MGDTGRYNFGQKCVFWAAIIFLVLLLVSGVIIWRPYFAPAFSIPVIRFALMLHSFAAVALIVVIMVHIYAALWVKGTITAMVEGWVTKNVGEETSPALVPRGPPETGKSHLNEYSHNPARRAGFERETHGGSNSAVTVPQAEKSV